MWYFSNCPVLSHLDCPGPSTLWTRASATGRRSNVKIILSLTQQRGRSENAQNSSVPSAGRFQNSPRFAGGISIWNSSGSGGALAAMTRRTTLSGPTWAARPYLSTSLAEPAGSSRFRRSATAFMRSAYSAPRSLSLNSRRAAAKSGAGSRPTSAASSFQSSRNAVCTKQESGPWWRSRSLTTSSSSSSLAGSGSSTSHTAPPAAYSRAAARSVVM